MDEREWQINCFGMETGKTMVKESWINGKYAFLFAKGADVCQMPLLTFISLGLAISFLCLSLPLFLI